MNEVLITSNDGVGIVSSLECIICYERLDGVEVGCVLCSNSSHYRCYKRFIKKGNNYKMKCVHCGTRSLCFRKKWWQMWCCLM